jgi:hypothetical protein
MNNLIIFKNRINMKTLKTLLIAIAILASYTLMAQVAVTTDGSSADPSAMLEVKSTDKGMLIPRVALTGTTDVTTISSPATSLLVYNTATAGDVTPGFYYWNGTAWTPMAGSSSSGTHYVGELYGGGVVFWVDYTGQHGLIASMVDLSTSQAWSNVTSTLIGTTNDWDGPNNTTAITGQSGHTSSAAKLCTDYTNANFGTGTYSDWYLPSVAELNHVWNNFYEVQKALTNDGNAATTPLLRQAYWSSSEGNATYAWCFDFYHAYAYDYNKLDTSYVRAVRAF